MQHVTQPTSLALPAVDQFYVAPPAPPPIDPEKERQAHNAKVLKEIVYWAKDEGDRIVADGKNLWPGLGNRSGLYEPTISSILQEKWERSGARLEKKLAALPPGTRIHIKTFRNDDRNRGFWLVAKTLTLR
jgi:hypothetical protein